MLTVMAVLSLVRSCDAPEGDSALRVRTAVIAIYGLRIGNVICNANILSEQLLSLPYVHTVCTQYRHSHLSKRRRSFFLWKRFPYLVDGRHVFWFCAITNSRSCRSPPCILQ